MQWSTCHHSKRHECDRRPARLSTQAVDLHLTICSVVRMQPLLHRFLKRIERAARAEAAAEAAEAAALEEAAFLAGSSDESSGDEAPLLQRKLEGSAPPSKGASKPPQPKSKSKLKLKLKVGGVSSLSFILTASAQEL